MKSSRAFTLMEVLVVISIIALLMAILVPGLALATKTARQMKSKTQLKGIHNTFVVYAEQNNGWYPSLNNTGDPTYYDYVVNSNTSEAGDVAAPPLVPVVGAELAFWLVLREALLQPGDLVSPVDDATLEFESQTTPTKYFVWDSGVTAGYPTPPDDSWGSANYSYATLEIETSLVRRRLWRDNGQAQLPIASDRAIDNDDTSPAGNGIVGEIRSIHTNPDLDVNRWDGFMVWNDGHVSRSSEVVPTRLSDETPNTEDDLFEDLDTLLRHDNITPGY